MAKIMRKLNTVSRCQAIYRQRAVVGSAADGLSAAMHPFVLNISNSPGRSQEQIARDLCINKSTACRALSTLETDGYILREENPLDKREMLIYPTERMLAAAIDVRAVSREWGRLITEDISEEELAVFDSVLNRIEKKARMLAEDKAE
ncbi:MAG: MarR family transcriptional regulator [Clostridia bacterium]|nr:MarR family transcriptional regulator [Clostridia bacterium]